jgi:hypothetical protein
MVPQNCHPDRSVAQWRDLLFLFRFFTRARKGWADVWRGGPSALGSGCVLVCGSPTQELMSL